jgi:putative ABC transport system permease protein
MDSLIKDVRFAWRTLRKNPGFTIIAIITIGLGIGACTAIFSIVNAVLLQPLPYADPSRLVLLWTELRARNVPDFPFPVPDVKDLRDEAKSFEGIAGLFPPGRATIGTEEGHPEQISVGAVTPNLFSLLGARIQVGRDFKEEDGTPQPLNPPPAPGVAPAPPPSRLPTIALLSHNFWQRQYGGDPSIVGKMVDLGGNRVEIVGVLASGFELLFPPRTGIDSAVDVWTALRLNFETAARNTGALRVIGRLKPGVTLVAAQTEAEALAAEMRERYPVKKTADVHFRVVPMHDDIVSEVRTPILALFGAVLFVLLIACANVANLLVVRSSARQRELVIRAAIGSSQWRLIRQLLTESVLISGMGAALGVALAQAAIRLLLTMAPAKLPRIASIGIDPKVLLFAAVATALTALVCGVAPAIRASRPDIVEVLRTMGSPGLRGGRLLRNSVVVTELALSFVLLIGFGLMLRSFVSILHVNPGYEPNHILTFQLQPQQRAEPERMAFIQRVEERLRAIPGVESVSGAGPFPLDGRTSNVPWATEAAGANDPSAFRQANFHIVRPEYFETLKTRVLAGRTFTKEDNTQTTDKVVIDDLVAARAFSNGSAVGQTLLVRNLRPNGPNAPQNLKVEVIGVVQHQRHESVMAEGREAIFFVEEYFGAGAASRWAVRATGTPESIAPAVRAAIAELDPKLPLGDVQPMSAFVEKSMGPARFAVVLIGIFAAIAIVLAAVGLYGVLSTVVRQRTAEIGMRVVLGATQSSILRLVIAQGLHLSIGGVIAGLAGSFAITGLMRALLVGVTPTDPATFTIITILFFGISVVASWLPAYRAARLDPAVALRDE